MLNHLSKFQRERSRQNDYKKKYVLCVGIFITIGLFALSHTLEDYATFHINQNEIQSKKLLETGIRHGDWDFYPFVEDGKLPEFGIVMGGTSDLFKKPQGDLDLGTFSTCVNKLYAMKRQYAFKLATNLEDLSNRTYGGCSPKIRTMAPWNKILLVIKYLSDVKNLLWIDMDAVIVRPNIPINFILNASHKVESQLGGWLGTHSFNKKKHRFRSNMTGFSSEPFFWASQDINALYWVNLNTAVFVVKNVPLAFEFLRDVWAIGDNPDHFKKHDKAWEKKKECEDYFGWPWEQGAVWDVLSNESLNLNYLRGTIFLPNHGVNALNSVTDQFFVRRMGTPFILHGKKIAKNHLFYAKTLLRLLGVGSNHLQKYCPSVYACRKQFKNITREQKEILRYEMST